MKFIFKKETRQFDKELVLKEVAKHLLESKEFVVNQEEDQDVFSLAGKEVLLAGEYTPIGYEIGYNRYRNNFVVDPIYEVKTANGMWFCEEEIGTPQDFFYDEYYYNSDDTIEIEL